MKVFISADIEGVTGVVHNAQSVWPGGDYERARKWMAGDVNAAVEGALDAGATEIVVNDAHGDMYNLILDDLHPAVRLLSGPSKPAAMMHGLDETFDAVFFIGYHARAGSRWGVINHTLSGSVVYNLKLNGILVGETGLNAALAGDLGLAVSLVTGDQATVDEAEALLGDVETVAVKVGVGRYAALCLHPQEARARIRRAARVAIEERDRFKPWRLNPPIRVEMQFLRSPMADQVELIPHVQRPDDRAVAYDATDIVQAYRLIEAMISLAAHAMPKRP
jgi:D-amino peptidase